MAGSNSFSLQAILSLTDDLTGPYKKTTNKVIGLNDRLGNSFRSLGSGITRGLKGAAVVGVAAISAGLVIATKEFISMEGAIVAAGAKFKDLDVTSDDYAETLKKLQDSARAVGRDTKFSAIDAAGALDKFAMAGFESGQSMALLMSTTDLAMVANTDLTTAVDIATDSLGAFNLVVKDEIQLQKNLTRVSDVMSKTTTTANTSLEEMFEAVKMGGPAFSAAGQDIESFSTLVGIMANSGVKGGEAGTSLRNIMLRLAKPTGEAADVMKELGIITQDSNGDFLDIIDIIGQFQKGLKGMGTAQRTAALTTVFGARSVTGMNILLAEGVDSLRDFREGLDGAGGSTRTMGQAIMKSLGNRLLATKSALTEMGFTFVEVFADKAGPTIDRLNEGIKNIDLSSIAIRFDAFINKILDNMPAIKQAFVDFLPAIKDIASQIATILGFLVEAIAKVTSFTAGPAFTAIDFLLPGGQQRVAERGLAKKRAAAEEERLRISAQNPRFVQQENAIQQSRVMQETTQRNDIFLHAPFGAGIATTPGGAPKSAINLGAQ